MNLTKRLLIVEDDEAILELMSAIFENLGDYSILLARDGEEALRIARVADPDVILLDIQLPRTDGYEVCRSVKSDPLMSHIKIIMLSGMEQNTGWQKAEEVGADGYIAKPFSSVALVEEVEELLRSDTGDQWNNGTPSF